MNINTAKISLNIECTKFVEKYLENDRIKCLNICISFP